MLKSFTTILFAIVCFSNFVYANKQCDTFITDFITTIQTQKQLITNDFLAQKIDTKYITKFSVGSKWREMTPQQRQEFYNVFSSYILTKYSKNFLDYSILSYNVISSNDDERRKNVCNVKVEITTQIDGSTKVFPLELVIYYEQMPLIQDVIFENLSLLQVHKQEISSLMQSKSFEEVINTLSSY